MRIVMVSALTAAAVALGSCATLDEAACVQGDWYGIGRADGAAGYQRGRLEDHAKACAKHAITPDAEAYDRGRSEGLHAYCTPGKGFEEARLGRSYNNVCPVGAERGFLEGYADGGMVLAANRRMNQARSDRTSAENRARDYENQIHQVEIRLSDPNEKDKDSLRAQLRRLRDDKDRAWDDARRAERRERDARYEVDDLKARFTPTYGPW